MDNINVIKYVLILVKKIEELLQEIYDQACRQLNEILNKLNSTNLGSEFYMDDKVFNSGFNWIEKLLYKLRYIKIYG